MPYLDSSPSPPSSPKLTAAERDIINLKKLDLDFEAITGSLCVSEKALDIFTNLRSPQQRKKMRDRLCRKAYNKCKYGYSEDEIPKDMLDGLPTPYSSAYESDSEPEDNYVESIEDLARVHKVDKLIESLKGVKFDTIFPNLFTNTALTVPNVRVVKSTEHIVALQTSIRDKSTPRDVFVFNSDRLIRIVIEESLNHLPSSTRQVETPTDSQYDGTQFLKMNCGVSIVRSGEAMERALRDCCRAIRIGKILIQSDEETQQAHVVFCKFPADLPLRKVLLLYPIMGTGNTVIRAMKTLLRHGVKESNIILVNLFCTPESIRAICTRYHEMTFQTTEIHPIAPFHFGHKYFGTA